MVMTHTEGRRGKWTKDMVAAHTMGGTEKAKGIGHGGIIHNRKMGITG